MKLAGTSALITGASQGLGKAIAQAFLKEGASILICARGAQALKQTARELVPFARSGANVIAERADVSDPKQAARVAKLALKNFPRLLILVNNAGILGPKGNLEKIDWKEWVHTIEVNLLGPVYLCRALLPHFKKQKYGKIINLSGGGAASPFPYFSAYAASKAAVVRFTENLAEEVRGSGITANAIAPGALNTRLLDEVLKAGPSKTGSAFYGRAKKQQKEGGASLENAARLAVFLASSESDRITGRLISAPWDPWEQLPQHAVELVNSDIYTLRRIMPKDRGVDWGERK